jgi:hypothetical protein
MRKGVLAMVTKGKSEVLFFLLLNWDKNNEENPTAALELESIIPELGGMIARTPFNGDGAYGVEINPPADGAESDEVAAAVLAALLAHGYIVVEGEA